MQTLWKVLRIIHIKNEETTSFGNNFILFIFLKILKGKVKKKKCCLFKNILLVESQVVNEW